MENRFELINERIKGMIDQFTYEILEDCFELLNMDVSCKTKSDLVIIIFLLGKNTQSQKNKQKIKEILDDAKKIFNNSNEPNKNETIQTEIEKIYNLC